LLKERGVEKVLVYGSILDEKRFQWVSDIDLALSGKRFLFREQLKILSLLEDIFGEEGFDAVFLTGEELAPRQPILDSILREGVDAEQLVKGS
jgi:predicted nucleotidyltransferase